MGRGLMSSLQLNFAVNTLDFYESGASLDSSLINPFESQQNHIFVTHVSNKIDSSKWSDSSENLAVNKNFATINQLGNQRKNLNVLSPPALNNDDSQFLIKIIIGMNLLQISMIS